VESVRVKFMKILIICEQFSPLTGAQALQASKVADALSRAGCEVQVLCGARQVSGSESRYPVHFVEAKPYGVSRNIFNRIARRIRHEFYEISSDGEWVSQMLRKAIEISQTFQPDAIITQSTPFRSHLIGLRLPDELQRKWVAYFSDLWPLCLTPYPYRTALSNVMSSAHLRSLGKVLGAAQKVIMSNEASVRHLTRKFGDLDPKKFFSVAHIGTPPLDSTDLSGGVERYAGQFVHVGRLTQERACYEVIAAIENLVVDGQANGIRFPGFTFVGWVDQAFRKHCASLERAGAIEFVGDVDPVTAQSICKAAGVLVVIEAKMPESPFLPSKFSDYAMLRKPILSVSPPGPIREYIARCGGGVAVGHDVQDIQDAMYAMVKDKQDTYDTSGLAEQFDAERVAQSYLEILERKS
jgi:glycosyltransferase involved in cell wall biosynthesis